MEALIEYGHALGRAHTGDLEGARKAIARMQQLRDATKDPKFDYFKKSSRPADASSFGMGGCS